MKLIRNNKGFTCEHCFNSVSPAKGPSRDHCPTCLYSKHVDHTPGDRSNSCLGLMKPTSAEVLKKERFKITFTCLTCGAKQKNISAQDDSMEVMAKLLVAHNKSLHSFS